jgi:hypothetical protein
VVAVEGTSCDGGNPNPNLDQDDTGSGMKKPHAGVIWNPEGGRDQEDLRVQVRLTIPTGIWRWSWPLMRQAIRSWTTRRQIKQKQDTYTSTEDDPCHIPWGISSYLTGGGDQGVPGEGATHPKPCKVTFPLGCRGLNSAELGVDEIERMAGENSRLMRKENQKAVMQSPKA